MMTGQGRELEAGEKMGVMGGFVSAEKEGQNKNQNKVPALKTLPRVCLNTQVKCFRPKTRDYIHHQLVCCFFVWIARLVSKKPKDALIFESSHT